MWWYYKKLIDDEQKAIYQYGYTTKEVSGQLVYDKLKHDYQVLKAADGDTDKGAVWALSHLPKLIREGFPDKRIVAIG